MSKEIIALKFNKNKEIVIDNIVSCPQPHTDLSKVKIKGYKFSHKVKTENGEIFIFTMSKKNQNTEINYQKCPKCGGQGIVAKPPHIPGDVDSWTSCQTSFACNVCDGMKIIPLFNA